MSMHPPDSPLLGRKPKKPYTSLTDKDKIYIKLRRMQGDKPAEIAQALGRSTATIYYHINKGQPMKASSAAAIRKPMSNPSPGMKNKKFNGVLMKGKKQSIQNGRRLGALKKKEMDSIKNLLNDLLGSDSPEAAVRKSKKSETVGTGGDDPGTLQCILERGGYSEKQVFCLQELGLVLKMMSQLTNKPEFRADHVTMVIGGNAEGDMKLKPLLVYHTENPRSLKGYIKEYFPVIWKVHPQVQVTSDILQSYVADYLSSACKKYAMTNNVPNKFLLILDSHLVHHSSVSQWAENIEVRVVPSHKLPMHQGITDIFKRYYHRRVMQQLVKATDANTTTSEEFWRQYNIKKAIHNISYAWNQVEKFLLDPVWHNIWPKTVTGSGQPHQVQIHLKQLATDIVRFSHRAGISTVDEEGVEALLASLTSVPSKEELAQIETEETDCPEQARQTPGLNKGKLKKLLDAVNKVSVMAESEDINMSRSDKFSQALECVATSYQKMYDDM